MQSLHLTKLVILSVNWEGLYRRYLPLFLGKRGFLLLFPSPSLRHEPPSILFLSMVYISTEREDSREALFLFWVHVNGQVKGQVVDCT
jgi:hypothetical protein